MDAATLQTQRALLERLAEAYRPEAPAEPTPALRDSFDLATRAGTALYESLSDADLLTALRQAAARLGHSPAQREVFWPYRAYLKARFGKWPRALEAAGLSRSAGSGGPSLRRMTSAYDRRQALLAQVRAAAEALHRVPHPTDLPEVCKGLQLEFSTWGEVLAAAGVTQDQTVYPIEDLDEAGHALLDTLRTQAEALGRAPLRSEVDESLRAALRDKCGSWRNALYQIGLEPVIHITPFSSARLDRPENAPVRRHGSALHDCYYRVLHLDDAAHTALKQVEALSRRLGRAPKRGEIPPEVRRCLQDACGSWSNALFQLGLTTRN